MRLKTAAFALFITIFASACGVPRSTSESAQDIIPTQPVLARVKESGTIRAGYIVYPPSSIKNPNTGQMSGIFVDVVEEAAKNLGLTIEWAEEVDWGTMIEGLNSGRYDIVGTPVWKNATRARQADFTMPIYFDGVGVYVKSDDNRFDNELALLDSSDMSIVSVDGGLGIEIALLKFSEAKLISLPQSSDVNMELDWISAGKADASLTSMSYAWDYQKKNPDKIKNIAAADPVRVFPNVIMLPKAEPDLRRMLDAAIEEMHLSGFIDQKIREYTGEANTQYYRVAPAYYAK